MPAVLLMLALVAGISLAVPSLRPTWKGTTTPVGVLSTVGAMVFLLSPALAISTNERLPLLGVPVGFAMIFGGLARDTGADMRRVAVLFLVGGALVLALLVTFRLLR